MTKGVMNQNPIVENPRMWNSIAIAVVVIIIVVVITIKFHHASFWYLFMMFLLLHPGCIEPGWLLSTQFSAIYL